MDDHILRNTLSAFLGQIEFHTDRILNGHINDGWFIHSNHPIHPETILQKVNTHVFPDYAGLMDNIHQVTSFLLEANPQQQQLRLVKTVNGVVYHKAEDGSIWRMFETIPNSYTSQIIQNGTQIYEAGKITGLFLKQLKDYPVENLNIPIPNFHNTPKRYQDFLQALSSAPPSVVEEIQIETHYLNRHANQFGLFWNALVDGQIPWRVTHNDTKLDNVLFEIETHKAICLVDLDTLMPGSALFDFGDALRAMGNLVGEEEPDHQKVFFHVPIIGEYARGYLEAAGEILTKLEIKWLVKSPWMMTIETGMRFLTDYLQGDRYFRTSYPKQNLHRSRNQLRLAMDMEVLEPIMEMYLQEAINK